MRKVQWEETQEALDIEGGRKGEMIRTDHIGQIFLPENGVSPNRFLDRHPRHQVIFEMVGPPKSGKTSAFAGLVGIPAIAGQLKFLPRVMQNVERKVDFDIDFLRKNAMRENLKRASFISALNACIEELRPGHPDNSPICERRYYDTIPWQRCRLIRGEIHETLAHLCNLTYDPLMRVMPSEVMWVVIMCIVPPSYYYKRLGSKLAPDLITDLYHQYVRMHHEVVAGKIPGRNFVYGCLDFRGSVEDNTRNLAVMIESVWSEASRPPRW